MRLRTDGAEPAAKQSRRARAGVDVGRLQRELTKTETALGQLTADLARRDISQAAYRLAADELEQASAALRAQLDEAAVVSDGPAPRGEVTAAEGLLRYWEPALADERNRALKGLIRQVVSAAPPYYREPVVDRVEVLWL